MEHVIWRTSVQAVSNKGEEKRRRRKKKKKKKKKTKRWQHKGGGNMLCFTWHNALRFCDTSTYMDKNTDTYRDMQNTTTNHILVCIAALFANCGNLLLWRRGVSGGGEARGKGGW